MSLALPVLESFPVASASWLAKATSQSQTLGLRGSEPRVEGPSLSLVRLSHRSLTPLTRPLAQHRESFSLFSGLDHRANNGHNEWDNYLCGRKVGDVSLDQIAAEAIGKDTRHGSLQLSAGKGSFVKRWSTTKLACFDDRAYKRSLPNALRYAGQLGAYGIPDKERSKFLGQGDR